MRSRRALILLPAAFLSAAVAAQTTAPAQTGSKIWIGRAAEIEDYIRSAKVVREEATPVGVTKPRRLYFEPDGPVGSILWGNLHGRPQGFWDSWKADVAAYELDKLLQLDMVPPVVEKRYNGEPGRASMWAENCKMWRINEPVNAPDRAAWSRQAVRMKMFDDFIGNPDRNAGNLLIDPVYNLILIDHTRAFTSGKSLPWDMKPMSGIDAALWDRMKALTYEQLKPLLSKWLLDSQIKDIFKRRDVMEREISALAAGGKATFFR